MFAGGAAVTAGAIYAFQPGVLQATPPSMAGRTDESLPPVIIYTSLPPHLLAKPDAPVEPPPERPAALDAASPPKALIALPPRRLDETEILEIQLRLRELALYFGPLDGVAGPLTTAAAARYEEGRSLAVTGLVDRTLLERLRRDKATPQTATAK